MLATLLLVALLVFSCTQRPTDSLKYAEVTDGFKTEYLVGDSFVASGEIRIPLGGDSYEDVPITAEMISGFDTSSAGDILVTVRYGDYKATVSVHVSERRAASLVIDEGTLPSVLYYKNPFPTTVTITVTMSDGDVHEHVPVTSQMVGGFNSSVLGDQTISISYLGASTLFSVLVKEDILVSITLVDARYKYDLGDSVSLAGAHLDVAYESGKVLSTTVTVDMVSGFSTAEGGRQSAMVTYKDKTCEYAYFVKKLNAISLVGAQSVYAVNGAVTAQGGHLELTYNDGEVRDAAFDVDMVSGFSTAKGGHYSATVTYEGLTCDYAYFVQKAPVSFELNERSLPATFEKGDAFPEGGGGLLSFNDGTAEDISYSIEQVSDFDTAVAGNHTAHITVSGITVEYPYTVLPGIDGVTIYGYTSAVLQGSDFDGLGEFIVVYETGERESIALSSDRLAVSYATDQVGNVTQSVKYRRVSAPFEVYVYAASKQYSVENIELYDSFSPIKIGDPINTDGVRIRINYSYLTPTIVECDPTWVSFAMPDSIEDDYVTLPVKVACFGVETTGTVRVLSEEYASRVTSLTPIGFKTLYVMGEPLSLETATLAVTFGGGYDFRQGVSVEADYITDFDTSMTGGRSMTVTYGGYAVSLDYFVISSETKDRVTDLMIYGFDPLLFEGDDIYDIDVSDYVLTLTLGYGYSSTTVPLAAEMLSGGPFSEAGRAEVTVTYADVVRTFSVNVRPESERSVVTSIRVPDTIRTYVGTPPDFSAADLVVTYGYGYEIRVIPLSSEGVSLSSYSIASAGYVRVVVTYEGVTCDAILSVIAGDSENLLREISVSEDSRNEFMVGEALDGVYLIVTYNGDRRPEKIAVNIDTMASDFTSAKAGKYTITISYGGRAVVYAYTVTGGVQEG